MNSTTTTQTTPVEVTVTLANSAFYDHTDRLYDGTYPNHMDVPGARLEVLKMNKMTGTVIGGRPQFAGVLDGDNAIPLLQTPCKKCGEKCRFS